MDGIVVRLFGSSYVWIISNVFVWRIGKIIVVEDIRSILQDVSLGLGVASGIVLLVSTIQLIKSRKVGMQQKQLEMEKERLEIERLKNEIAKHKK